MKVIIYFGALLIISVISIYMYNFNYGMGFSKSTEIWGQFGDYLGGVLNPILTFLSIVLLIKSIDLQRKTNEDIIKENRRQEKLDYLKFFEVRFYSLIDAQRIAFDKFKLIKPDNEEIKHAEAVNYLEEVILDMKNKGESKKNIENYISKCDVSESIYSSTRRFYLLLKLIDQKLPNKEKNEYYEVVLNLTDYPLVRLMVLVLCLYDWDIVNYINSSNVLEKDELKKYRQHFEL